MTRTAYNTIFHAYLLCGLAQLTARVQAAEPLPDERDREQAWHLLSYAFRFAEAWPYTRALLLTLAPKMEQAGFREEWLAYLQEGHRQAQARQDELAAAECELQMGLLYRLLSRFVEAQQWTSASVEHFAELGEAHGHARALNELAWLEHLQQNYQSATQYAHQAIGLADENSLEQAMSYRVLGMIAVFENNFQIAEQFHRKALAIFEQHKDIRGMAWCLQNVAYTLHHQHILDRAIHYYRQALDLLEKIKDKRHYAIVQLNLGNALFYYGEPDNAVRCLIEAGEIFKTTYDQLQYARTTTNLGLAYLSLERYTEAENAFLLSIYLYEMLGDKGWQLNGMDGLAMTYLATQEYEQAIKTLRQALEMLPDIVDTPNYEYLHQSLNDHLIEAMRAR